SRYEAIFRACMQDFPAFDIHLRGITMTSRAVMVQGFPAPELNHLRERLRESLQYEGLGDTLDLRYKITAAHVTIMRFASFPQNLPELHRVLRHWREQNTNFGSFTVREIEFVENDYFLSAAKTQTLYRYSLK